MNEQPKIEQTDLENLKQQIFAEIENQKFDIRKLINKLPEIPAELHQEIAEKLITSGNGGLVGDNLDKFSRLAYLDAEELIRYGFGRAVASYIEKIDPQYHNEIALMLVEDLGQDDDLALMENLEKFRHIDYKQLAEKMIKSGKITQIAKNFQKFKDLDSSEIALNLITSGHPDVLAANLHKFGKLEQNIALTLIYEGYGQSVAVNLDIFTSLDQEVALALIKVGQGLGVINNLNKFAGLDSEIISFELIKNNQALELMNNMDYFDSIDQDKIAEAMIEVGQGKFVKLNPDIFNDLSPEMREKVNTL